MTSHHIAFVLSVALRMLPSVACVIGAYLLASRDKEGWGWLLLVAVILRYSDIKID